ncbi:putative Late nodulin [Medicago truncatula]|uniref:Nodule Cysteine-Rich (NCR) secreted peptide n=1 Tax=Medicago truncatula TaxID=3880 RepID=A0A072V7Y1_MEDTR|nr:Nodule Cysteine-Rich (NCR) secreted peptide [Medicago truncatula]RHN73834.1 putative Late nodulin [Medicago truncatula]
MAKIMKFVHAMILFLFLFAINVTAFRDPCNFDFDCRNSNCTAPYVATCMYEHCYC